MVLIILTGSADLAASTPPLHYHCRSILSPVTIYDLEDMQKAGWRKRGKENPAAEDGPECDA